MAEKNCQSCHHHSSGYALDHDGKPIPKFEGDFWKWQECAKDWGKPKLIGVLKNMCGMYMPKKNVNKSLTLP